MQASRLSCAGSSRLPSMPVPCLPFALLFDLPSCPLEVYQSPSVWQHLPSHALQAFVFVLRMRSHQMRPQSRPPTPPPPLPVPPLAPPLTQPRALALSRRALTRLRGGLQQATWYTVICPVRCTCDCVMHDCMVILSSIQTSTYAVASLDEKLGLYRSSFER